MNAVHGELDGTGVRQHYSYLPGVANVQDSEFEELADGGIEIEAGTLDGVLLFSPRTAALFAELVTDAGLSEACREMSAYCLSPAVAEKAQSVTWRDVVVAAESNQEALLRALGA